MIQTICDLNCIDIVTGLVYLCNMYTRNAIVGIARAKVNLALHVCCKQHDSVYHELDSVVVFPDVYDKITAIPANEYELEINGTFGRLLGTADNIITRAFEYVAAKQPYRFVLQKNLPVSAGIGGGSANAAAVLRMFGYDANAHSSTIARKLGADVPVCLLSKPTRMQGIGEKITPVAHFPACGLVLVNPRCEVSTQQIFQNLQPQTRTGLGVLPFETKPDFYTMVDWLRHCTRNDLQNIVQECLPVIGHVLAAIGKTAVFSRMSGSGATCFGLYSTRENAQTAADILSHDHPDWWVAAGSL